MWKTTWSWGGRRRATGISGRPPTCSTRDPDSAQLGLIRQAVNCPLRRHAAGQAGHVPEDCPHSKRVGGGARSQECPQRGSAPRASMTHAPGGWPPSTRVGRRRVEQRRRRLRRLRRRSTPRDPQHRAWRREEGRQPRDATEGPWSHVETRLTDPLTTKRPRAPCLPGGVAIGALTSTL